jgi:hypothetical protein
MWRPLRTGPNHRLSMVHIPLVLRLSPQSSIKSIRLGLKTLRRQRTSWRCRGDARLPDERVQDARPSGGLVSVVLMFRQCQHAAHLSAYRSGFGARAGRLLKGGLTRPVGIRRSVIANAVRVYPLGLCIVATKEGLGTALPGSHWNRTEERDRTKQ